MISFKQYIREARRSTGSIEGAVTGALTGLARAVFGSGKKKKPIKPGPSDLDKEYHETRKRASIARNQDYLSKRGSDSAPKSAADSHFQFKPPVRARNDAEKAADRKSGITAKHVIKQSDTEEHKQRKEFKGKKLKADVEREQHLDRKMKEYEKEGKEKRPSWHDLPDSTPEEKARMKKTQFRKDGPNLPAKKKKFNWNI